MSTRPTITTVGASDRLFRIVTRVAGVGFLVFGILGFVPGIVDYAELTFAGTDSTAQLFGLFRISILHNLVHLGFGLAGLVMSRTPRLSQLYLVGGGFGYLVLSFYGFFAGTHSPANFLPFNTAANWLHLVLACVMMAIGMSLTYGRGEIRRRYGLR